jgi:hypothetical protein
MKKDLSLIAIVSLACILVAPGCKKNSGHTRTYTISTPILEVRSAVLAAINGNTAEPVVSTGKIYVKDNYIFLNELDKGIHVIDNTDPRHPASVAFLKIPGNQDIAVRGNTLYADMNGDLLALDITDPRHAYLTKSLTNIFTQRAWTNDTNMVVVGYNTRDTTVEVSDYPVMYDCMLCMTLSSEAFSSKSNAAGIAGSMAKMVLLKDYLYVIPEPHSVSVIDVHQSESPVMGTTIDAGFDLETIYPFEDKLFLGSATGLFMFDVSDPLHPTQLGQFSHGRACDPVVTDGRYAYVTLHSGTSCGGDANELNIIDVRDLMNPSLVKSYGMTKPGGLSKDGDLLFICDGDAGVKLYNAADVSNLKYLRQLDCPQPYYVITQNKIAMVVAKDGIYQFDYNNAFDIKKVSVIRTGNVK